MEFQFRSVQLIVSLSLITLTLAKSLPSNYELAHQEIEGVQGCIGNLCGGPHAMSQSEQRRIAREHRALIKRYFSYTGQARTVDSFQIPYNDSAWCTACKSHKFEKNVFNWARTPDRAYHSVLQLQSEPHFMQFFEQNQCDNAGARCKNLDEYELPTTTKTRCTQRMTNTTVLAIDQTKVYLIDIEVLSGCVCECSGCDRKR